MSEGPADHDLPDAAYRRRWVEEVAAIIAKLNEWTDGRLEAGGGATDREKELLEGIQHRMQQVKDILAQLHDSAS